MKVNMEYMNRIYLAPRNAQPTDGTDLWINVGWNTKGNMTFPEWIPALAPVCTKDEYDQLATRMIDYIKEKGFNVNVVRGFFCGVSCLFLAGVAMAPLAATGSGLVPMIATEGAAGACCVGGCLATKQYTNKITEDLKAMLQDAGWRGVLPPRLQLKSNTSLTGETPDTMGIDQYGTPLKANIGDGNDGSIYGPVWPPLGYNLVVTIPKAEGGALNWPGVAPTVAAVAAPVVQARPRCLLPAACTPPHALPAPTFNTGSDDALPPPPSAQGRARRRPPDWGRDGGFRRGAADHGAGQARDVGAHPQRLWLWHRRKGASRSRAFPHPHRTPKANPGYLSPNPWH